MLNQTGWEELKKAVFVVHRHVKKEAIGRCDAVNLWAAVIHAWDYSVIGKTTKTIVVSAKMFWYLKLAGRDGGKCVVVRVAVRKVGSKNRLKARVYKFLCAPVET